MVKKTPLELGRRERQLVDTVVKLKEASVSDVRANLDEAPSYSSVRAMLGLLVEKGWLKFRQDGKRYLYSPAGGQKKTQRKAVSRLVETFFGGSATDAMAALLDSSSTKLSAEELRRMKKLIQKAEKERK